MPRSLSDPSIDRRHFLRAGLTLGVGLTALGCAPARRASTRGIPRTNALVPDPEGIVDLPPDFSYRIISRTGETMDDGFRVPGAHDGMATFARADGRTLVVRNHELLASDQEFGPFGASGSLRERLDASIMYDPAGLGGTTTLVYDTRSQRLEEHHLSLAGTLRNCAGGPTPWGAWITCEESVQRADSVHSQDHGFNFEVRATSPGLTTPMPLRAMGRFNHEAIAVDRGSGVVYQTEDRTDSLFYRFVPSTRGNLLAGGRLQALKILDMEGVHTSNHTGRTIDVRRAYEVEWVDLEDVESPADDLRLQGAAKGAAQFARGEGIWSAPGVVFFAATNGGANQAGQIWRYRPSPFEGTDQEASQRATLDLFVEPNDAASLDLPDNIVIAPSGDVLICEDGPNGNFVRGLTPSGELYPLVRNRLNNSEFAGAAFSPDGTTLFVNIQRPGLTLAISGPWAGLVGRV